jgi:transposase-like protein
MNAVSDVSTINHLAAVLERSEAHRLGVTESDARKSIARRLGVSPGTLENIRRLRTKVVPNWLMNKVRVELIAVLQLEIQRLEHEIHIARQTGSDHREDALCMAETQLAKARKALEGEVM